MGSTRILINNLCNQYSRLCIQQFSSYTKNALRNDIIVQYHPQSNLINWRYSHSFFSRTTAEQLWKGVTSVSPAGRKKGRGKGLMKRKDLNRGQVIGFGKKNMLWPGLNSPVIQGREVMRQQELPPDETREKKLIELRDKLRSQSSKRIRVHPLERGWSGTRLPGQSFGPPDPVGDEKFEGFDSKCIQLRVVMHMHGQRGRVRTMAAIVVTGNKNGLAGFAYGRSRLPQTAAKAAKNKAAKNLRYIERDGNTVIHDFFSEFGAVKIFVERRPEGFGLVCHRAIKAICEMLGIKDLYAKVEGPARNTICLTRAFFIGLMRQKSLKDLANEKGLHVVKLQSTRDFFPEVVASPDRCRTEEEMHPTELTDFNLYLHKGKVVQERKKYQPFYINFPSYIKEMKDREKARNHRDVRIHMLAKYGALTSFIRIREAEKAKQELKDSIDEEK